MIFKKKRQNILNSLCSVELQLRNYSTALGPVELVFIDCLNEISNRPCAAGFLTDPVEPGLFYKQLRD